MSRIGILGAGTWGMALARMLSVNGHDVSVWSALPQELILLEQERKHPNLPGMVIPEEIHFTAGMAQVCREKDIILFAVPSVFVRSTAEKAAPYLQDQVLVDVAKGIEPGTLLTMSEVIRDVVGDRPVVALSGPTHAEEVALDLPTTIVSACREETAARLVQEVFSNSCMRVYTNPDVLGVELCGAMKNIMALACGAAAGLGYGDNTRAALMTRGIAEMARLGLKMGCRLETFAGLAGIGDLIVTATSMHSRNNRCGMLIGQGVPPKEAIKQIGMVVEGINALPAALELSARYQVELPITQATDAVVNHGADPRETVLKLMARDKKSEI